MHNAEVQLPPISETLDRIYRGLGDATLAAEAARLEERLLDAASKLAAINNIRGLDGQYSLFTQDS